MYKKILVPVDGSELAECVLPHVESIARGCGVEEITFLRAIDPYIVPTGGEGGELDAKTIEQINRNNEETASEYLKSIMSRAKYGAVKVETKIITGKPADAIVDFATKNGYELVILATHGRSGISRWIMGSVADRVVHAACVPVLLVRSPNCKPNLS